MIAPRGIVGVWVDRQPTAPSCSTCLLVRADITAIPPLVWRRRVVARRGRRSCRRVHGGGVWGAAASAVAASLPSGTTPWVGLPRQGHQRIAHLGPLRKLRRDVHRLPAARVLVGQNDDCAATLEREHILRTVGQRQHVHRINRGVVGTNPVEHGFPCPHQCSRPDVERGANVVSTVRPQRLPSECDGVTRSAHVSRTHASGLFTRLSPHREVAGGLLRSPPSEGGGSNPSVSSSRFSTGGGARGGEVTELLDWPLVVVGLPARHPLLGAVVRDRNPRQEHGCRDRDRDSVRASAT